jgi:hypothetical protein
LLAEQATGRPQCLGAKRSQRPRCKCTVPAERSAYCFSLEWRAKVAEPLRITSLICLHRCCCCRAGSCVELLQRHCQAVSAGGGPARLWMQLEALRACECSWRVCQAVSAVEALPGCECSWGHTCTQKVASACIICASAVQISEVLWWGQASILHAAPGI